MLKIKNNVTEMKSVFNGLIILLGTAEERIHEIEDKSIETSLTEIKRENNENKTELAIPSVGEDGQQQGFQFIADANAK